NVGYLLTNSGGFAGTTPVLGSDSVDSVYTVNGGQDPSSFGLLQNGTNYNISELYGNSFLNEGPFATVFGWYDFSRGNPVLHQIFTGQNTGTPGASQVFSPVLDSGDTQYGFYATVCFTYSNDVCTSSDTFFSDSSLNTDPQTAGAWNHFALFQLGSNPQSYVI